MKFDKQELEKKILEGNALKQYAAEYAKKFLQFLINNQFEFPVHVPFTILFDEIREDAEAIGTFDEE